MREMNWKYVKIINLSDYKTPKSKEFYEMIKGEFNKFDSEVIHSIFSKKRKDEMNNVFSSKIEFKIVVAWGVSTKLHNLIQLTLKNNNLCKRMGNDKKGYKSERRQNFYYYHPLQRGKSKQTLWLEQIIDKLES